MADEKFYALDLDNYALPGFVSGTKYYFGTLDMIKEYFDACRTENELTETARAFNKYLADDTETAHYAAYNTCKLVHEAEILGTREFYFTDHEWVTLNLYKCKYYFRADTLRVKESAFLTDGKSFTGMWIDAKNMEMGSTIRSGYHKINSPWGLPCYFKISEDGENRRITSRLFTESKSFKPKEEALAYLNDEAAFSLNAIGFEIFGDG